MEAGQDRDHRSETSTDRMITAVRETAARLNCIIQSAMDAIITVDERQDIVIFNPAAERMFGCQSAVVLGTPLEQFIPARHREMHHGHVDQFGVTGATTRRMGGAAEIVGLRADGAEFPIEASISQVSVGGKKLFTVILRDITARKQAEEALRDSVDRYQRLVELVPDAIWVERESRIAFANRACLRLLGAESAEQLVGRSPLDFIHPEFHALAAQRRERLGAGLEANPLMEKRVVRIDGGETEVDIAEASFHDEGSVAILAVLRDITERKRAERELHESRERLRQLSASLQAVREEEKARIARELHDELGQALTGLKMDLAQIADALGPEQQEVMRRADAMKSLIEATVTSVRRLATELRPLMLDDLGLVSTIEWLVNDFSRRTSIAVELTLPGPDFDVDAALSTALFRVLQESLTNVARHAHASRVRVALTECGSAVRLEVHDDGTGMDTATEGERKTFGLLGMRERAGMLGGELTVESSPGAGTLVMMIIPRTAGDRQASQ
jgi:PAS domain S-box-containing protein